MEVVVTTGAMSRAKLQSNRHHQQTTNQHQVFYRPDALPVTQPAVSKHWREKNWYGCSLFLLMAKPVTYWAPALHSSKQKCFVVSGLLPPLWARCRCVDYSTLMALELWPLNHCRDCMMLVLIWVALSNMAEKPQSSVGHQCIIVRQSTRSCVARWPSG